MPVGNACNQHAAMTLLVIIAESCDITHQAVLKLIDTHLSSIEGAFGPLGFEMLAQNRKAESGTRTPFRI